MAGRAAPLLSQRALNRALLARQGLLAPFGGSPAAALRRLGGLQAQYAPSMYVGLLARCASFARADLDRALVRDAVVQGTLLRSTIHLVARDGYWPSAVAVRDVRRRQFLAAQQGAADDAGMRAAAARLTAELAGGGTISRADLERLVGKRIALGTGLWVDLVRAPPSGTWAHRRADLFALAADRVGPEPQDLTPEAAVRELAVAYLRAYGPAARADLALYTGLPQRTLAPALDGLALRRFTDAGGRELLDLPRAPLPDPATPAPVRFLGTWDATLLVHARRTGLLPEVHRPRLFTSKNPHSEAVFLLDGVVAGVWHHDGDRIVTEPFGPLDAADRRAVAAEAERVAALHA